MELLIIGLLLGGLITLAVIAVVWIWPARAEKPPSIAVTRDSPRDPESEEERRERDAFTRDLNKISNYTGRPPGGKRRE